MTDKTPEQIRQEESAAALQKLLDSFSVVRLQNAKIIHDLAWLRKNREKDQRFYTMGSED